MATKKECDELTRLSELMEKQGKEIDKMVVMIRDIQSSILESNIATFNAMDTFLKKIKGE